MIDINLCFNNLKWTVVTLFFIVYTTDIISFIAILFFQNNISVSFINSTLTLDLDWSYMNNRWTKFFFFKEIFQTYVSVIITLTRSYTMYKYFPRNGSFEGIRLLADDSSFTLTLGFLLKTSHLFHIDRNWRFFFQLCE